MVQTSCGMVTTIDEVMVSYGYDVDDENRLFTNSVYKYIYICVLSYSRLIS